MSGLNTQIKVAIDSLDIGRARELLREAMKEANAETFYLASLVALDDEQKHEFLEKALSLDPFHEAARRASKESTQTKPTTAPVPSAAKQLLGKDMVAGKVKSDTSEINLYAIPVETGLVVTTLRSESTIYLIARDDDSKWYQVLYQSPIGIKYGWVNAAQVHDIHFNGNPINTLDIPITNFELNSRDDVKHLIAEMRKNPATSLQKSWFGVFGKPGTESAKEYMRKSDRYGCASSVVTVVLAILGLALIANIPSLGGLSLVLAPIFGIYLLIVSRRYSNKAVAADALAHASVSAWDKKLKRFEARQLAMRSDYEVMRDDQRRDAAIGFAANLGANLVDKAATRYFSKR